MYKHKRLLHKAEDQYVTVRNFPCYIYTKKGYL